jgi:hypothetical protein
MSSTSTKKHIVRGSLAALAFAGAALIAWRHFNAPGVLDAPPVALDSSPADIVRFTATRTYTQLPVDKQMEYLMAWGNLPQDVKAKTLADLSKEPYVLDLSSANSKQTSQLHVARQYFAAPPEVREQIMDQVIDHEQMAMKAVLASMKQAEGQGAKFDTRQGDQKLRKLLIESTPAGVRMEVAAFVAAKQERMKERGL